MSTPKKKHLIELMIEAGVKWPYGAEYSAQDKRNNKVYFFSEKPVVMIGEAYYCATGGTVGYSTLLPSLCRDWHKTIVTREQYAEALSAVTPDVQHEAHESEDIPAVDAVEWHNPQSIEQLTANYHAKAAEADRLQAVADEALKDADDALLALEKAGELIGLVISIDTKPRKAQQPVMLEQPEITDWRDLRIGDVVEYVHGTVRNREGKQGEVCEIDESDNHNRVRVMFNENEDERFWCSNWRLIRRP